VLPVNVHYKHLGLPRHDVYRASPKNAIAVFHVHIFYTANY
jgi:hypothetical protein